ncbi:hypothetical protein Bca4012_061353 [Brassica carinata]
MVGYGIITKKLQNATSGDKPKPKAEKSNKKSDILTKKQSFTLLRSINRGLPIFIGNRTSHSKYA